MTDAKPLLVTSSWYARLPDDYARIGISRGTPRGQRGYRMYRKLAPGAWLHSVSEAEYCRLYMEILGALKPHVVLAEIQALAGPAVPALLCFEKPPPDPQWCHRGIVSAWFEHTLGLNVPEFGHEQRGTGCAHPKNPPALMLKERGFADNVLFRSR